MLGLGSYSLRGFGTKYDVPSQTGCVENTNRYNGFHDLFCFGEVMVLDVFSEARFLEGLWYTFSNFSGPP